MKIASANLTMASAHASQEQYKLSESLKITMGSPRSALPANDPVDLSDRGKNIQAAESGSDASDSAVDHDPQLNLIRRMLEFLTGYKIRVFDAAKLQAQVNDDAGQTGSNTTATDYAIDYQRHESYTESEQTAVSISGSVKTADGQEINFDLQWTMARHYHEESETNLHLGNAAQKTDPLVLNFAGPAAQLIDQRFAFDLNADGQTENINFVAPGSGFLVFDRNEDGKINNGQELFGPTTGDGFSELNALDSDRNGWIDENDSYYKKLQIWSHRANGEDAFQSLAEANVGAIALNHIASPFDLKNQNNELLGQVRSSGIFLQEDGRAGTIQQIDLTA